MATASDISLTAHGGRPRQANTSTRLILPPARNWPRLPRDRRRILMPQSRPRSAASSKWQALTPHARARYLYALARLVQKHSRRLAVLETMDNGKPIRESRDIDIPLVARHFYHHAGWAQLLHQEFPGYVGLRRCRSDHSLEFSVADAGVEDCAGAGYRQHGRSEAGGIHAADRAGLRRNLPRKLDCLLVWSTLLPATAQPAKRWSSIPTWTRLPSPDRPKWDAPFAARLRPATKGFRWNSAANRLSSSSKTPISIARSKDWSTASGSTRDKSAAPARAC